MGGRYCVDNNASDGDIYSDGKRGGWNDDVGWGEEVAVTPFVVERYQLELFVPEIPGGT